jgi:voltage-gated potassium channel
MHECAEHMTRAAPPGSHRTGKGSRRSSLPIAATIGLLGVIALLLGMAEGYLAAVVIASIAVLVASFHYLLHSSRAFAFALANFIGIYSCVFLFFAESNFDQVGVLGLSIGFLMPLLAFLLGSLWRRGDTQRIVLSGRMRDERRFAQILLWLVPVFAIGALTFFLPHGSSRAGAQAVGLFGGMLVISIIVFAVSHNVAVFLLDTALLFEAFFQRITRLVVPAFAFLTFYFFLVILFASFYSIADKLSGRANFRIDGVVRALSFPESLYFSLTTLSTVGYGDISPASNLVRLLIGLEIVCGILLLLFGFNEIFSFAQEQSGRRRHEGSSLRGHTSADDHD